MAQRQAYTQWVKRGTHTFMPSDNIDIVDRLETGVYNVQFDPRSGAYELNKKDIVTDKLIDIPQPEAIEVMDAIKQFYNQKEEFRKWDFVFKRGFLLYGVPGGGKTSIISKIIKFVTETLDGVVFVIYNEDDLNSYASFMRDVYRTIEPDRILVTVFEDIDGLCGYSRTETLLINVLDGLGNHSNVLNIATTNYTERLSDRILKRPNRFDRKIEIKSPHKEARKSFFEQRLLAEYQCCDDFSIDEWVNKTEGMTLAQMGELVKSVCVLKNSMDDSVEVLTGNRPPNSDNYNKPEGSQGIGFAIGNNKEDKNDERMPTRVELEEEIQLL